jgi:hypothetical protein
LAIAQHPITPAVTLIRIPLEVCEHGYELCYGVLEFIFIGTGYDWTVSADNQLSGPRQFLEIPCQSGFFFHTEATLQVLRCLNSFDTDI